MIKNELLKSHCGGNRKFLGEDLGLSSEERRNSSELSSHSSEVSVDSSEEFFFFSEEMSAFLRAIEAFPPRKALRCWSEEGVARALHQGYLYNERTTVSPYEGLHGRASFYIRSSGSLVARCGKQSPQRRRCCRAGKASS